MPLQTVLMKTMRPATRLPFRPAMLRQLRRRNFTVSLQPGLKEQEIAHEASTYWSNKILLIR